MAIKDRLVGADASLYTLSLGAEVATGTATSGTWYMITAISGTGSFPSGYTVGDLVLGNGQTLSATNKVKPATETLVSDCNSFDLSFSSDEIEVTTLSDDVKKYRKGKTDLSGTINGINTVSEMKKSGSFLNRFLRTVSATSANVSTLSSKVDSALYGKFFLQDDATTSGETQAFLFGQIELFGYTLGAAIGDAQNYSSGVRFIGNDPIVYFKDNA